MNYEELIESRKGGAMKKETTLYGSLYKKVTDGAFVNALDFRYELTDNLRFRDALNMDAGYTNTIKNRHQLHFTVAADSTGIYGLTIEPGQFKTLATLFEESPAVIAEHDFVSNLMSGLVELTTELNKQQLHQVCFSPTNVFVRKGDHSPMLLLHGSSFLTLNDQEAFYGASAAFVAPEVLEEGVADSRSDVFSLGKLLAWLYQESELPLEYKGVVAKATQQEPDRRYQSVAEMLGAMTLRRNLRSVVTKALIALALTLLCVGAYLEFTPEQENIDFVEPAPHEDFGEEMYPEGYDPVMDLGLPSHDSVGHVDEQQMKAYQTKAEQIFRKRYKAEAERILSKVYDNDHMNDTEKAFMAASTSMMEELTRLQVELGGEAGLTDAKSQRIASEIIETITNAKKAKLNVRTQE